MHKTSNHKQQGFAVVELAIIAVVIVALAGVGYFVYQRVSKSDTASNGTSQEVLSEAGQAAQSAAKSSQSQAASEASSGANEANSAINQDSSVDSQATQAGGSDGTNL